MFEPAPNPRLFGLPPGSDFAQCVADGIRRRLADAPPEAMAAVVVFVNTRRMQRRLREVFAGDGAALLPRIRLVTEIAETTGLALPPAASTLRRRLELAQLVRKLIEREPGLAPPSAAFALADGLAELLDELQGEGVAPGALHRLDVSRHSAHWERSRRFLAVAEDYVAGGSPGPEERARAAAAELARRWAEEPCRHPVIVAGSTGSRGSTALLMAAVARLPQGAVVLPGFDFTLGAAEWEALAGEGGAPVEDHPQYRFARLAALLGMSPTAVASWDDAPPPNPPRNRLVSLALRPAPATDAWMTEGPRLDGIAEATAGVTLIDAPSERSEAVAIALRLRAAVEEGRRAALISPDRMLTRRVAAALDRWGIEPDDSAGRPLAQSPPGRLLLQVAGLFGRRNPSDALIAILKHPLVHTGSARADHLRHARDLELHLRRRGPPYPAASDLTAWGALRPDRTGWAAWVAECLADLDDGRTLPLEAHVARHLALTEAFARGPDGGESELWKADAGEVAARAMAELVREAPHGGPMAPPDYLALLRSVLEAQEVRDPVRPDARVMIWGTLEARVQGADLAILGGLNEGTWPQMPSPDPWMNRQMRREAGLLLPERRIGLAAHDFQQAIAAREVVLSRSRRGGEAETVPSRWLNRLTTLLDGVAPEVLAGMRRRGEAWLATAAALEAPREQVPPAPRPAPRPPEEARPTALSVTEIETLVRDPYAIYARHVLGLRPLDPLRQTPDARLRGSALHRVLETFVREGWVESGDNAEGFRGTVERVLAGEAPWPFARLAWGARLLRIAGWFLEGEAQRRSRGTPLLLEAKGSVPVGQSGVTLTGKADRIDLLADGTAAIYDYKTGTPPSAKEQDHFDKQLPLLAALAARGAFAGRVLSVSEAAYIGLTSEPKVVACDIDAAKVATVWEELERLLSAYRHPAQGFLSRRAAKFSQGTGAVRDYDHLARYGEWSASDDGVPEDVG